MSLFRSLSFALVCAALAVPAFAQYATNVTVTDLHDLNAATDGGIPYAPVMQASDGNYYGVTDTGGSQILPAGTIFRIVPGNPDTFSVVHTFDGNAEGGGGLGLVEGPDGNLYGATSSGGPGGNGVFFKFNLATAAVTVLHSFGAESSGQNVVTLGSDGNFYVVSDEGGSGSGGSLFQLTPAGAMTLLYSFTGPIGQYPVAGVMEISPGIFYGTTQQSSQNAGSIYKAVVTTSHGASTAVITAPATFNAVNGLAPYSMLVQYSDGNLYGVSRAGDNYGNLYSYVPGTSMITSLYDFGTDPTDTGQIPTPQLLASDGNFYVVTNQSVQGDCYGSLVELTAAGADTVLFDGNTHHASTLQCASAPLLQGSDGNLYATSTSGGASNAGTIAKMAFSPALSAPIQLTSSTSTPEAGVPFTLTYLAKEAFSLTQQQCYAYVQGGAAGAGSWTGRQTGAVSGSAWTGSANVTATAAGTYTYALTCGGTESGFLTLTVAKDTQQTTNTTVAVTPSNVILGNSFSITANVVTAAQTPVHADTVAITIQQGSSNLYTSSGTPDTNGNYTVTVPSTTIATGGPYTATASFAGDPTNYAPSSESIGFTVQGYGAPGSIASIPLGSGSFLSDTPIQGPDLKLYGDYGTLTKTVNTGSIYSLTLQGTIAGVYTSPNNSYKQDFLTNHFTFGQNGSIYSLSGNSNGSKANTLVKITTAGQYSNVAPTAFDSGYFPSQVVQGSDGNFYSYGQDSNSVMGIYRITPAGGVTLIHAFSSAYWIPDVEKLVELTKGTFYGEANQTDSTGLTEIEEQDFTVTTGGVFTVLQDRSSNFQTLTQILAGADGNWYGLAEPDATHNFVKYNADGTDSLIHAYGQDDDFPIQLLLASDGNFYATTLNFSEVNATYTGALIRLGVDGLPYRIAVEYPNFSGNTENVIQGSDGNIYFAVGSATNGSGAATDAGDIVKVATYPQLPAPVQVTLSSASIQLGQNVTVSWKSLNSFSAVMQNCAALVGSGGGTFAGLQTGTLTSGVFSGSSQVTPTAVGTYSYAITCGGIESGAATLTVTSGSKTATTTMMTVSPNPVEAGQITTVSVTVAGSSGTPTGTVNLDTGSTVLATATLSGGKASFVLSSKTAGTIPINAVYNGDSKNLPSSSSPLNVVISKATSTLTATSNKACVKADSSVTLNAQVAGSDATGTVVFSAAGYTIGQGTLAIKSPTLSSIPNFNLTTNGAPSGHYTVTGTYGGDSSNLASTGSFSLIVMPNAAVTMFANPMTVAAGGNVSFSVDVGCNGPIPTGTVKFEYSGINLEEVTLSGGVGTSKALNSTGYPAGKYSITAVYSGDANYPAATSAPVTITLQ